MTSDDVQGHYATAGTGSAIAARIVFALREAAGADVVISPETLAPFDQFHGGGLAATEGLAALLDAQPGDSVLDIGGGIGGPARWIASTDGCNVTSVDLTAEYCEAARELNRLAGLTSQVTVLDGSALALPLADHMFDHAYSQFAVMNISDKAGVYREAFRVLKPGGRLVLSHMNAGNGQVPAFPLPWATLPSQSFLATDSDTRRDLLAAGFEILDFVDVTPSAAVQSSMRRQLERDGMPAAGSHILAGDQYLQQLINALHGGELGHFRSVVIVAAKP
jgi:sarcosine/dimethylglycine N-methyltransferase